MADGPVDLTPTGVRDIADLKVTLRIGEEEIAEPSMALLRIKNTGTDALEEADFVHRVRFTFNGRSVVGHAVTESSESALVDYLAGSGDGGNKITLDSGKNQLIIPKFLFNRRQSFNLLVLLSGSAEPGGEITESGLIKRGKIVRDRTKSGRPSRRMLVYGILILVSIASTTAVGILTLGGGQRNTPCVPGQLTIEGSTAFGPIVERVADSYRNGCGHAIINVKKTGSIAGINNLYNKAGADSQFANTLIAMSDGQPLGGDYPALKPWPVGVVVFAVVIHKGGVPDALSLAQLQAIYRGEITNWEKVGGIDKPIRIVGRDSQSGTRRVFENNVIRSREPTPSSDDCRTKTGDAAVVRCERNTTDTLLETVNQIDGAIGYAELSAIQGNTGLPNLAYLKLDGSGPDVESIQRNSYSFWAIEYFYTYGQPKGNSLMDSFIRYVTSDAAKHVLHDLSYPILCASTVCHS